MKKIIPLWILFLLTNFVYGTPISVDEPDLVFKEAIKTRYNSQEGLEDILIDDPSNLQALEDSDVDIFSLGINIDDVRSILQPELDKYPEAFLGKNIKHVYIATIISEDSYILPYYAGPDYIVIAIYSGLFELLGDKQYLAKTLHRALSSKAYLTSGLHVFLPLIHDEGELSDIAPSYAPNGVYFERTANKAVVAMDMISTYATLLFLNPEQLLQYAQQSEGIEKAMCSHIDLYNYNDSSEFLNNTGIVDRCRSVDSSYTFSFDIDLENIEPKMVWPEKPLSDGEG